MTKMLEIANLVGNITKRHTRSGYCNNITPDLKERTLAVNTIYRRKLRNRETL